MEGGPQPSVGLTSSAGVGSPHPERSRGRATTTTTTSRRPRRRWTALRSRALYRERERHSMRAGAPPPLDRAPSSYALPYCRAARDSPVEDYPRFSHGERVGGGAEERSLIPTPPFAGGFVNKWPCGGAPPRITEHRVRISAHSQVDGEPLCTQGVKRRDKPSGWTEGPPTPPPPP